jgi:hypothetical protein
MVSVQSGCGRELHANTISSNQGVSMTGVTVESVVFKRGCSAPALHGQQRLCSCANVVNRLVPERCCEMLKQCVYTPHPCVPAGRTSLLVYLLK